MRRSCVPPCQTAVVQVQVDGTVEESWSVLIESCELDDECIQLEDALVTLSPEGSAEIMIMNTNNRVHSAIGPGLELGQATRADVMDEEHDALTEPVGSEFGEPNVHFPTKVRKVPVEDDSDSRSKRLEVILEEEEARLRQDEQGLLKELLEEYHDAFSLEPQERGETDLVQFQIETREATPRRQPPRRMPFGAKREGSPPTEGHTGCKGNPTIQQPVVQPSGVGMQEGQHAPLLRRLLSPQRCH